ncbi:MAG: YifB family Mg chelatase-like AAA ATPase [Hydrogenibacillus schlegelii]|uniref:YifB family Mg chelatase-like AAA ATPase n=1 Tax=Hydrogenibacillus schlegelii TaxID=1484 RepID=A0A947CZP1_HYDSH|nr:YifB family Mg chelatase-like AAA ATPase [Hydrogenibacillus schlegelii]
MVVRVFGATVEGVVGLPVAVEVDLSGGLPAFDIVGLPDGAVREARERVRAAIRNSGFQFPLRRITVSLAPADRRKEGSGLDLPIAVAILAADGQIRPRRPLERLLLVGELSLDGGLKAVRGTLAMGLMAKEAGFRAIVLPAESRPEAAWVRHPAFLGASLRDVVAYLEGKAEAAVVPSEPEPSHTYGDLDDVFGQPAAKRALLIAAAGFHSALLIGPPGAGKTMLAERLPRLLPPLDEAEMREVMTIYDVAGMRRPPEERRRRPFRAPHHTITTAGLIGGGNPPRPGEVTLAHRGVLFLDELPEFSRRALEVLRQPLESGRVWIGRTRGSVVYPARFLLIAAMNPCPCGYYGFEDERHRCRCRAPEIARYRQKISGPIADRFDLVVDVPRPDGFSLWSAVPGGEPAPDGGPSGTPSGASDLARRLAAAFERQRHRFRGTPFRFNGEMDVAFLRKAMSISPAARRLFTEAVRQAALTGRGAVRALRVARTIADLDDAAEVAEAHVAEALAFRVDGWNESL